MKEAIKRNLIRFAKKTFWRILGKIVEIAVLFLIGYSLGLRLVRY
jgi:hypothetical protein